MQSEKFKKELHLLIHRTIKLFGKKCRGFISMRPFWHQDIVDNRIVSPAYGVWDINDGLVIPKYLEMVLRSPKSIEFYRSKLTGT